MPFKLVVLTRCVSWRFDDVSCSNNTNILIDKPSDESPTQKKYKNSSPKSLSYRSFEPTTSIMNTNTMLIRFWQSVNILPFFVAFSMSHDSQCICSMEIHTRQNNFLFRRDKQTMKNPNGDRTWTISIYFEWRWLNIAILWLLVSSYIRQVVSLFPSRFVSITILLEYGCTMHIAHKICWNEIKSVDSNNGNKRKSYQVVLPKNKPKS